MLSFILYTRILIRNIRICLQFSHNLHIMQVFRSKNLPFFHVCKISDIFFIRYTDKTFEFISPIHLCFLHSFRQKPYTGDIVSGASWLLRGFPSGAPDRSILFPKQLADRCVPSLSPCVSPFRLLTTVTIQTNNDFCFSRNRKSTFQD